jgi:hypothetical protein
MKKEILISSRRYLWTMPMFLVIVMSASLIARAIQKTSNVTCRLALLTTDDENTVAHPGGKVYCSC